MTENITTEEEDVLGKSFNASDPAQVKAARKKAKRETQNRQNVVKLLMQHKDGRAWLWQLMESCFIHGNPVVPGDPYVTYFNLGQQNIGKLLLMDALKFSDLYSLMVQEAQK